MHHLAYFVDRIDPYLDHLRAGGRDVAVLLDAAVAGEFRFVYLEGLAHGPVIELIETSRRSDPSRQ